MTTIYTSTGHTTRRTIAAAMRVVRANLRGRAYRGAIYSHEDGGMATEYWPTLAEARMEQNSIPPVLVVSRKGGQHGDTE